MRPRDRRAVVVGGVVVAVAWFSLKAGPEALRRVTALETAVDQRAGLLERAYGRLATLPQLEDSIDHLTVIAENLPSSLLSGPAESEAATHLMDRVRPKVEEDRVVIRGFGTRDLDRVAGPLSGVGVVVTLETDLRGLTSTLSALEADSALAVDQVRITGEPDHEQDPAMEVLTARISVSGWFQSQAAEARDAGTLAQTEE